MAHWRKDEEPVLAREERLPQTGLPPQASIALDRLDGASIYREHTELGSLCETACPSCPSYTTPSKAPSLPDVQYHPCVSALSDLTRYAEA